MCRQGRQLTHHELALISSHRLQHRDWYRSQCYWRPHCLGPASHEPTPHTAHCAFFFQTWNYTVQVKCTRFGISTGNVKLNGRIRLFFKNQSRRFYLFILTGWSSTLEEISPCSFPHEACGDPINPHSQLGLPQRVFLCKHGSGHAESQFSPHVQYWNSEPRQNTTRNNKGTTHLY